jgi:hypothetical protein
VVFSKSVSGKPPLRGAIDDLLAEARSASSCVTSTRFLMNQRVIENHEGRNVRDRLDDRRNTNYFLSPRANPRQAAAMAARP